jgi:hypothetical protein
VTHLLTRALVTALVLSLCVAGIQTVRLWGRTADLGVATARLAAEEFRGMAWEQAAYDLSVGLATCQSQWEDANRDADAAAALAQAYREEGVRQYRKFQSQWESRSKDCAASLQQMQTACETQIGDY